MLKDVLHTLDVMLKDMCPTPDVTRGHVLTFENAFEFLASKDFVLVRFLQSLDFGYKPAVPLSRYAA